MMSLFLWSGHVVIFIVIWLCCHCSCFFYQLEFTFTALGLASIIIFRQRCFLQFQIQVKLFLPQDSGLWCLQGNDQFSEPLLSSLQFKIMIGSQNHFCHCCRSKSTMLPCSYSSRCILTVHFPKKAKNQYSFVFCSFLWLLNLEPLNERYATEQQHKACMYFGLWVCTVPIFFKN